MSRVLGCALLAFCSAGCIYLPEDNPYAGLNPGDVTGVAVGRLQGVQTQGAVPLQGVTVRLEGSGQRAITRGDGRFTMRNLPEGNHHLRLTVGPQTEPLALLRVAVRVRAVGGQRASVDLGRLELLAPSSLSGSINIQGQGSMEDVRVTAADGAGVRPVLGDNTVVTPLTDGSFVLDGLGAGTWRVLVAQGARTLLSGPLNLAAGTQLNVGTLALPSVSAPLPAVAQLTLRAPPGGAAPVTLTLTPGHPALRPCSTALEFTPSTQGQDIAVTGCTAGGPYSLLIESDGVYLPYVRNDVLLLADGNNLGDVFLTRPEDCQDCVNPEQPDAGAGSGSSSSSSGGATSASASLPASSSSAGQSSSLAGSSSSLGGTSTAPSSSSSSSGGVVVEMGDLVPTVPGLTAFNSWVSNPGGAFPPTIGTDCTPGMIQTLGDCQHVGIFRQMVLTTITDCTTISEFRDSGWPGTNIFTWECMTAPMRVVSTGLAAGHGLADLLNWATNPPTFRTDFQVEVLVGTDVVARSRPSVPWTDDVATYRGDVTAANYGTNPLVLALDADLTQDLRIQRDHVAVTTSPLMMEVNLGTFVLVADELSNRVYLEGRYRGTVSAPQVKVESFVADVEAVRIHNLHTSAGLLLARGRAVRGTDIHADRTGNPLASQLLLDVNTSAVELQDVYVVSGVTGLQVSTPSVSLRGIHIRNVSDGIRVDTAGAMQGMLLMQDVDIQDVTNDGVIINNSNDVRMTNIRVANAGNRGMFVDGSARVVLMGGTFSNNGSHGLDVGTVSGSVFRGVVAAHNDGHGIRFGQPTESLLAEVTAVYNRVNNIFVDGASSCVFSRLVSMGATAEGIYVSNLVSANNFFDIATAGNTQTDLAIPLPPPSGGTVFHGALVLDNTSPCIVLGGHPDLDPACDPIGASDHIKTPVVSLGPEFSGPVPGTTSTALALSSQAQWTSDPSLTRVWAPTPLTAGRCTTDCALNEYGLVATASALRAVNWLTTPSSTHQLQGASTQQYCESLGGTFTVTCVVSHVLSLQPWDPTPGATAGLCQPRAVCAQADCNCSPVNNIGAYQGHGGYAPAVSTPVSVGNVLQHDWLTNGY